MTQYAFDFTKRLSNNRLPEFVSILQAIQRQIGFKVSSRGWCYLMEQAGYITKAEFDKIEDSINRCRKLGILPVDFVAEEDARAFSGVVVPSDGEVADMLSSLLREVVDGSRYFTPNYWEGEQYYIQVLVEKTDLKTLFEPVCREYNIPIANSKGWSSILQRAEYAKRFQEAEANGLTCVLLYGGDFDPDGVRISDTLRANLDQLKDIRWKDGTLGYDPQGLIVERFCLEYDFIQQQGYTWIDNLITGTKKNLASPKHFNFTMPYVQDYLNNYGARKCEANVLVTTPDVARNLMRETIENYLGEDALGRFQSKRDWVRETYEKELERSKLGKGIRRYLEE